MSSKLENRYNPDVVSSPGETILDLFEEKEMSVEEFAELMGRSRREMEDLLAAKIELSSEIAADLERVFAVPAHFWENGERNYREFLLRQVVASSVE